MDYLKRFSEICAKADLFEAQIDLLRDLTDPLYKKDRECNIRDIHDIISNLVIHKQCQELAELIQDKWAHIELEPDAYENIADDVSCG